MDEMLFIFICFMILSDYILNGNTATGSAVNRSEICLEISIIDDTIKEPTKYINITVDSSLVITRPNFIVTIIDNEGELKM